MVNHTAVYYVCI